MYIFSSNNNCSNSRAACQLVSTGSIFVFGVRRVRTFPRVWICICKNIHICFFSFSFFSCVARAGRCCCFNAGTDRVRSVTSTRAASPPPSWSRRECAACRQESSGCCRRWPRSSSRGVCERACVCVRVDIAFNIRKVRDEAQLLLVSVRLTPCMYVGV